MSCTISNGVRKQVLWFIRLDLGPLSLGSKKERGADQCDPFRNYGQLYFRKTIQRKMKGHSNCQMTFTLD
jgi:hypothetical protein